MAPEMTLLVRPCYKPSATLKNATDSQLIESDHTLANTTLGSTVSFQMRWLKPWVQQLGIFLWCNPLTGEFVLIVIGLFNAGPCYGHTLTKSCAQ